jgi:hypothetical protein
MPPRAKNGLLLRASRTARRRDTACGAAVELGAAIGEKNLFTILTKPLSNKDF